MRDNVERALAWILVFTVVLGVLDTIRGVALGQAPQDGIEYGCFKEGAGPIGAVAQEDAPEAWEDPQPAWDDPWDGEWLDDCTEDPAPVPEGSDPEYLHRMGVVESEGEVFTWYSENVLPGGGLDELNSNGRHADEDGLIRDADGYIAVASPWGADEIGTVVDTPWGEAKVYDYCENDSYDVYVNW